MNRKQFVSREIELFYNKASEETRLNKGMGPFEFERIKSLIEKYIPGPSCSVLDVGGGTGKYSEWLAQKGHRVHMVEPLSKHLKLAQTRASRLKNRFSIHQGASPNLSFPNSSMDLVILHGPLYHLQNDAERRKSIAEAKRVLRKNGILLGFAINRTASTLAGLLNGLIHKKAFLKMCKEVLATGVHSPSDEFPWLLSGAFCHHPEQLREEFTGQGLTHLGTYAVEGMVWLDKNFFSNLLDEKKKGNLIELLEATEKEDFLLSLSPHMMIAAKKKLSYGK